MDDAYLFIPNTTRAATVPGSYSWPLLGHTVGFVTQPYETLAALSARNGPVGKLSIGGTKMVYAVGPDLMQEVLEDRRNVFSARMGLNSTMGPYFRGGLLVRDFADHRQHRRLLIPAFGTRAMRGYAERAHRIVDDRIAKWSIDEPVQMFDRVKELLLDVSADVFFGIALDGEENERLKRGFHDLMAGSFGLIKRELPGFAHRKGMRGRRSLEAFFEELVTKRQTGAGTDLASQLVDCASEDDSGSVSQQDIAHHLLFTMLAAHDTTSSAIVMALLYLSRDPAWQQRLRDEYAGLEEHPDHGTIFSRFKSTNLVFKESMRLHPPLPAFLRRSTEPVVLGGVEIPAHTVVHVSPIYNHRMESIWERPNEFDPDRFGDARAEHKQHPYLYVPFGGGAHRCIGRNFGEMVFKIVLQRILSRFTLSPAGEGVSKVLHFPFPRPMDGLPLRLTPVP